MFVCTPVIMFARARSPAPRVRGQSFPPKWRQARALGCCLYDSVGRMDTCGRWLMIACSV